VGWVARQAALVSLQSILTVVHMSGYNPTTNPEGREGRGLAVQRILLMNAEGRWCWMRSCA